MIFVRGRSAGGSAEVRITSAVEARSQMVGEGRRLLLRADWMRKMFGTQAWEDHSHFPKTAS
jgi:hypothetical protein